MVKTCEICEKSYGTMRRFKGVQMLCPKHYYQMKRHGKILERTKYDDTQIIKHDGYAEIVLYNRNNEEVARTKISLDMIDRCKDIKWHLHHSGYVYGKIEKRNIQLSRFIMGIDSGFIADHINGDILDNRTWNLRKATHSQNGVNRKSIKGVRKIGNRWYGRIMHNYKEYTTKGCDTRSEVILERNKLAVKLHGEFATIIKEERE